VRRALGASRRDLFTQHMVEVSAVAGAGAVLGLGFGALGLAGIRSLYSLSTVFLGNAGYRSPLTWRLELRHRCRTRRGRNLRGWPGPAWRVGRLAPPST
jgi:hypothetical protein